MSKAHILTIQVCIQRADGTISIYDEFPHMLRYEEEEEYLEALKYRLPLRRFDTGPLCDYECLCDVLNETYREYCHDIDLAPGERLLIRYADKPEDAPLSKKEAAKPSVRCLKRPQTMTEILKRLSGIVSSNLHAVIRADILHWQSWQHLSRLNMRTRTKCYFSLWA